MASELPLGEGEGPRAHPPQVEKALAQAVACGQPEAAIRSNFGLRRGELAQLLRLPHIEEQVEAKRAQLLASTSVLMAKTILSAEHALDNIIAKSNDFNDRDSASCSKYLIDKVLAAAPQKVEVQANLSVDAEVLHEIVVGLDTLKKRGFGDPQVAIAESRHLHSGAEVMEERDAAGTKKGNGQDS